MTFFTIFFRIFFPWSSMNVIRDWNFILTFLAYLIPFWQKIMLERGFLIFWIFLPFFLEFSCQGQVWTEFGTKFFFFSFSAYLIPIWIKIMLEWFFFLVFWIFLLFLSEFSCPSRVWTEFGSKIFYPLSRLISSRFG